MGSIGDGIATLFGGGSGNRGVQRDSNNQGAALDNSGQSIQDAQKDFNQQDGPALGWAGNGLQNAYHLAGQQAGTISNMGGALDAQGQNLRMQSGAIQAMFPQLNNASAAGANQEGAAGAQNQMAGQQGGAFGNSFGGAFNTMLGSDGLNPDGSAIANFDPFAQTGNSLISKYSDSVAPGYDNAVTAANHDLMQRGMSGANTLAPSEIGDIRRGQASDVANFGRNLGVQAQQEKYARLGHAMNMISGVGSAAMNGYNAAGSGYGGAANTFGNVAQGYGSAGSGYGNVAGGFGNMAQGFDAQGNAINRMGNAFDSNASGWEGLANSYGAAGNSRINSAGAYGNLANGWANGAQGYQNQANNQVSNLKGLAGLFGN